MIDLDNTLPPNNNNDVTKNLPSSQIDFDDDGINANPLELSLQSPQKFSADLISGGSSGSTFNLGQRLPSYCETSEGGSSQDIGGPFNIVLKLPDIILSNSSGSVENDRNSENILETLIANDNVKGKGVDGSIESNDTFHEAQRFPSTFLDDTLPTALTNPPAMVSSAAEAKTTGKRPEVPASSGPAKARNKEKGTMKGDMVSQRTHTIRPLPLESKTQTNRRRSSRIASITDLEPIAPPASTAIDNGNTLRTSGKLAEDSCLEMSKEFAPAVASSQNISTLHTQRTATLYPESLRVSQELSKDCTVFNNTSLLRAADQIPLPSNNAPSAGKCSEKPLDVDTTVFNSTSLLRAVDYNCIPQPPEITSNATKEPLKTNSTTAVKSGIDLVPPIKQKFILYHGLLEFHYFNELTRTHIATYRLSTFNYGLRHFEATIICSDLKTKVTNRSLAPLGYSCVTKPDLFALLKDLDEFHYSAFGRSAMEREVDLRERVLFWYIYTTPPFCFVQLLYDEHNSEFSECKSIQHLGMCDVPRRQPFKCLTNAIKPHLLNRLKMLKNEVRNKK